MRFHNETILPSITTPHPKNTQPTCNTSPLSDSRTKWKRQTIVGYEIMEAGNFAAFQRLYSAAGVPSHPSAGPYWPYPGAAAAVAHHAQNDLLYRQAAVTLQKPMPYRLYSPAAAMMLAGPSAPQLVASNALNSLGGYYGTRDSPGNEACEPQQQCPLKLERSKSLERSPPPPREQSPETPTSCKHESDDESIHDV